MSLQRRQTSRTFGSLPSGRLRKTSIQISVGSSGRSGCWVVFATGRSPRRHRSQNQKRPSLVVSVMPPEKVAQRAWTVPPQGPLQRTAETSSGERVWPQILHDSISGSTRNETVL
uniref:(northern house mosquito) hypothetical protein n=1 Tax=Culex pipiens TaxID=7175 RepID=A0A8D8IS39_CULPI